MTYSIAQRMSHEERKGAIINAALQVAATNGFHKVTRKSVAEVADCSCGLVQYHFNTMEDLKSAVLEAANTRQDFKVLAQVISEVNAVNLELVEPTFEFIRKRGSCD